MPDINTIDETRSEPAQALDDAATAIQQHLALLGLRVRDRVSGFDGVVTTLSFDLYGCIQAVVTPPHKAGTKDESGWYDVARLEVIDPVPVLPLPDFDQGYVAAGLKGPADKPIPSRH